MPLDNDSNHSSHWVEETDLVSTKVVHVLEQGLPKVGRNIERHLELSGWKLQQNLERLRLGSLTASYETFPHLLILPHLTAAEEKICRRQTN